MLVQRIVRSAVTAYWASLIGSEIRAVALTCWLRLLPESGSPVCGSVTCGGGLPKAVTSRVEERDDVPALEATGDPTSAAITAANTRTVGSFRRKCCIPYQLLSPEARNDARRAFGRTR